MSDVEIIDVHNHVYPTADLGRRNQEALGLEQPLRDGTVEEMLRLNDEAGITHAALILYLSAGRMFERRAANLPPEPVERELATAELKETLTQRMIRYNAWGVAAAKDNPRLLPFVGVDPVIMGRQALIDELEDKFAKGAKGVKIHPGNIGVYLNDPRLRPVYEFCDRTGLPLLTQSGAGGMKRMLGGFEPMGRIAHIRPALEEFKNLHVIAAHFNLGCDPHEIVDLARTYAGFYTDLSNQLGHWGSEGSWTVAEGVEWIRRAGANKVVFGSNYVVADPVDMAHKLRTLPLTDAELVLIANANARELIQIS
jgi:predicted TIM-barrel fold metal-dependent hydrolase